jgi:DNA polymerase III epsilon subunit-like protein
MSFDEMIIGAELLRHQMANSVVTKKRICTKEATTNFCAIPSTNGFKDFKWPRLSELHVKLFGADFEGAHNAMTDVLATAKCFWELKKRGVLVI